VRTKAVQAFVDRLQKRAPKLCDDEAKLLAKLVRPTDAEELVRKQMHAVKLNRSLRLNRLTFVKNYHFCQDRLGAI
jgi:hypothetical protein